MKKYLVFVACLVAFSFPVFAAEKETAYDRVMQTKTLRCGYFSWPPYLWKDLNTGDFHGFYYDYVEAMARHLGIKIDWAAEVLYGNVPEEIRSGRIDAFCSGIWPTSGLALSLDFSKPVSYNAVQAYVRADDRRFDGDVSRIDDPGVSVVSMEGSIGSVIAAVRFPKARLVETPAMSGPSAQLMDLVSKKADVTFVDTLIVHEFEKKNPGKVRSVGGIGPVNVWGNAIAFGKHEEPLVNAVNTATEEMLYSGEIDAILKKYDSGTKDFYRAAKPYENGK